MTTQRNRRPLPPRSGFLLQPPLPRRRRRLNPFTAFGGGLLAVLVGVLLLIVWLSLAALGWAFVVYIILLILKVVFGLDVPLLG